MNDYPDRPQARQTGCSGAAAHKRRATAMYRSAAEPRMSETDEGSIA